MFHAIAKEEFRNCFGYNAPPVEEEIGWYSDGTKTIFGVILASVIADPEIGKEYSSIILKKNKGAKEAIDLRVDFKNFKDAEEWLVNWREK
jgi:hypothetical protein